MRLQPPSGMRLASAAWAFALAAVPAIAGTATAQAADVFACCGQLCCCQPVVAQACCPEQATQPCCSFTISTPAGPVKCDCVLVAPSLSSAATFVAPAADDSAYNDGGVNFAALLPQPGCSEIAAAQFTSNNGQGEYYAMLASTVLRI